MDSNHSSYSYTSMNNSMVDSDTVTAEESGWTTYFEDFMLAQQQDHQNNSLAHKHQHDNFNEDPHHQQLHDQPELSDAASYVEWNNMANSMNGATPKFDKKLNLIKKKNRRTRNHIRYDDSLEDTASSPVNSPKVGSPHMGFNQIIQNSLGKRGDFEDGSKDMTFQESNNGSTDLRKRGLCLVPLSVFINI
ncbi:hypothetical protein CTI12_AA321270 [Artemisia annua]|uniref:Uncharacterized protein n=1 Tax=Artemisia annua TaxID=35608 RepID=A0A2U1N0R8_ARTAN|nr:hypothetical protein CTI12_AA321270 [Artemisia annua]